MTRDEIRTAGLLFGEELALGLVAPGDLLIPAVQRAVRGLAVPSVLSRRYQRALLERGRLSYERHCAEPMMGARRAVLGEAAEGRPKFLVRVDAFPHLDAWAPTARNSTAAAHAFHELMVDAGVPYLMAVTPRVARQPLDPGVDDWRPHDEDERALLARLRRDGVDFALHGLDHRTRSAKPRRRSELSGRRQAVEERLDTALATLREEAIHTDVVVPPFDRFDARCWPALASRFALVAGGPASVDTIGFHLGPSWRGEAIWLPSYPPLHGSAAQILPAVRRLVERQTALWIPLVLDWAGEPDGEGSALRELAAALGAGELARSWEDFLLAVRASRQLTSILEDATP